VGENYFDEFWEDLDYYLLNFGRHWGYYWCFHRCLGYVLVSYITYMEFFWLGQELKG
jgi:hypothetical protein